MSTQKKQGTGLAAFSIHSGTKAAANAAPGQAAAPASERQRGKGASVSLTVRVSRDQWKRIHELAVHEGKSINALATDGLSRLFQEKGLKPL